MKAVQAYFNDLIKNGLILRLVIHNRTKRTASVTIFFNVNNNITTMPRF